jgi:predicted phosphodiesterase
MRKIYLLIAAIIFITASVVLYITKESYHSNLQLIVNKRAVNFIVVGDWGHRGHYKQQNVANQMSVISQKMNADFFISTGDNFYPTGVTSINDQAWTESYENVYKTMPLQKNWYVVLGNHDYGGNVQAQVDYTKISQRWKMPARYYAEKKALKDDSTQQILLVFLDTSPLVSGDDSDGKFVEAETYYTAMQLKWLDSVLDNHSPAIKWKIVLGHHPLYTGSRRINAAPTKELHDLLQPVFEKHQVDAYICGHDHSLQYIKPPGTTHYFISGAGSQTTSTELYPGAGRFAISENGFIAFSVLPEQLLAQIINERGEVLYATKIKK